MASAVSKDSQLRLVLEAGQDENGEMIYKNKNYNNIKTSATTDELYAVAQAIVGLQSQALVDIERNDKLLLSNI